MKTTSKRKINNTMKKKRNKRFNKIESVRKNNERILKGFAITFIANDNSSNNAIKLINLKGDELQVTKTMSDAITVFRYKWFVYLIVGFFNSKNERELKVDYVQTNEPYLQSELVEYLNDRHQKIISGLKSKNVKLQFAGWIARASGRELELSGIYNIFDKQRAWN